VACKPAVRLLLATLVTDVFGFRYAPCRAIQSQIALQPALAANRKHDMVVVRHIDKGISGHICITCRCKQEAFSVRDNDARAYDQVHRSLQALVWAPENVGQSNKQWKTTGSTVD